MAGRDDRGSGSAPAVSFCAQGTSPRVEVLAKRADFLRAAQAARRGMPGFLLQARRRTEGEPAAPELIRIGYTCSKKIGNAVARNRAKRRLREAARAVLPELGRSGWDYVLVGKPGVTVDRPFDALREDLTRALERIHG